jgi:hypothetical protein
MLSRCHTMSTSRSPIICQSAPTNPPCLTNPKVPDFAAGRSAWAWLPLGLSDSELGDTILSLAAAVPIEHRGGFLRALADVIGQWPADTRGPVTPHRAAAQLQRDFLYPPAPMTAQGSRSKYR